MDSSKDCISVRVSRLNTQVLNKVNPKEKNNLLTREGLFDALQILYDECNTDYLKSGDKNITGFVEKYRKVMMELKRLRVNIFDFEIKNVIGRGHFGEVHVVRERQTGDVYAMKTVKKYENSELKSTAYDEERNIMAVASSAWITKLQYAFQDNINLYFVMEYHPGGDLLGLLERQGGTLPESAASFYLAELVLAINDLHEMGYIHRDIKPDNILLDRCGHLKLADFGSSAKLNAKGEIISGGIPVGTPDYIAPEALQSFDNKTSKTNGSYGKPCDYWSLGILAYELTVGTTPFTGQNTTATYSKIINYSKSLKFPSDVLLTQAYISLITGLLTDQVTRLDYTKTIKHALFKNTDFNSLRDQVPPFVPKISSLDDTSNFSDLQSKRKLPNMENFKAKTQFSGRNLPFIGFTFTTEPPDLKTSYQASFILKDDEKLKGEIETLQTKLIKMDDVNQEKEGLERKLEEKVIKLASLENVRDRLERDLANNIAECQALKRTLDLERKDRTDLERKALDLIKGAKLKWEASEKIKLDNVNRELEEAREKINKLLEEIEKLNDQLQKALNLSNKHKASVDNVETLRRSSVMGLESRLEKVTTDSQNKLTHLQHKLSEEIQKTKLFEKRIQELESNELDAINKLKIAQTTCDELNSKCSDYETTIFNLNYEINELNSQCEEIDKYKNLIVTLEEEILDIKNDKGLEKELQTEIEANLVLKKQLKDLKTELNSMRASKLSSIDDLKAKYETNLAELKLVSEERNELHVRYQELEMSLDSKEKKVDTLEELLNKLQSDLAKIENGSEREGVLQEQIERLEHQIIEISENAALDKQDLIQLKSKYWRMEKDLTNAELDKKIVERDLKEEQNHNLELQKQIESLNEKIEASKQTTNSAVAELGNMNEQLHMSNVKLKDEIKNYERKLEMRMEDEQKYKDKLDALKADVQSKEMKISEVQKKLDCARTERMDLEKKFGDTLNENRRLSDSVNKLKKEQVQMNNELEKRKREVENSYLNRDALREACTLLESQLEEFETVLDCSEVKRQQMQVEITTLQNELAEHKKNFVEAKKSSNEEKTMKLLAESKCKRLLDDLENLQKELDSFKKENVEFKNYSNGLSEELTLAEQKIADYEIMMKTYERQIESYISESNYLKEENSEQLTFINSIKSSNYKLEQNLNKSRVNCETLIEKMNELNTLLNEKEQQFKEREMKFESTISQQTKLIDFLQSKMTDKKKKTFSDKIFGHSKKENVPLLSVALNYKDLEAQLCKEKESNKVLHEEICKLKSELYNKTVGEIKNDTIKKLNVQDEALAQIVQSPASQKNDLYRQNSVQRMHHNIPHRFESKISTRLIKCAQCLNTILLGRNTSVCKECHVITHTNCASSLPRTCGLPTAFAQHYTDSLSKLNNKINKNSRDEVKGINIEGWVKVPVGNSWEKQYACLTETSICIYNEPPNNSNVKLLQSLQFNTENAQGKVILEPLASEIGIPVANSDLPFIIKIETSPNSTCWPAKCVIFMTLSIEDKDKWFKGLQNVFQANEKYKGDIIISDVENLQINCLIELKESILLGSETGLYALQKSKPLHILGPLHVYDIIIIDYIKTVLMIVDERRVLISCDLNHLQCLTQAAQCTKPSLKFKTVNINDLDGFHIIKEANFGENMSVCVATPKQLIILKYDMTIKEFIPIKMLDTAEPVSCILFTEQSVIIGADKFFEVDLNSFQAIEFLDSSDNKLTHAVKCYKIKSFPLAILEIVKGPQKEYLVCFNEFAIFVDENGRSTRKHDITWTHLPTAFHYDHSYLYVVQFNTVEVFKILPKTCNTDDGMIEGFKIDMNNPQHLGSNKRGIFVLSMAEIRHLNAMALDDSVSITTESTEQQDEVSSNSDRFSFTSSMVQSLDGHLSDVESVVNTQASKKVKFQTDL